MLKYALSFVVAFALAVSATASNIGLRVDWTCISNCTDFTETGILLAQSPEGTNWTIIATLATNVTGYTITNLPDLSTRCYRVAAYNTSGTGDWSNVVCKTTTGRAPKVFQVSWVSGMGLALALLTSIMWPFRRGRQ